MLLYGGTLVFYFPPLLIILFVILFIITLIIEFVVLTIILDTVNFFYILDQFAKLRLVKVVFASERDVFRKVRNYEVLQKLLLSVL